MVGKITKQILNAKNANELRDIYDKLPVKCKQWNAAFMINKATPSSIKCSINKEDPKVFEIFTNFKVGDPAASACTLYSSNYWEARSRLSVVRVVNLSTIHLENYNYFNDHWIGFCPAKVELAEPITCLSDTLPAAGVYWDLDKGFLVKEREKDPVTDSNGNFVKSSFYGRKICKVYSAEDLFEAFIPEEQVFEQFVEEMKEENVSKNSSQSSLTLIETLAQLILEEDFIKSITCKEEQGIDQNLNHESSLSLSSLTEY